MSETHEKKNSKLLLLRPFVIRFNQFSRRGQRKKRMSLVNVFGISGIWLFQHLCFDLQEVFIFLQPSHLNKNRERITGVRCPTDINSARFRSQLDAPNGSSHWEQLWYNETVCLWMTIYHTLVVQPITSSR